MPRRKKANRKSQPIVFRVAVNGTAASISRSAEGARVLPGRECSSSVTMEGTLDHAVAREIRTVIISVFEERPGAPDTGAQFGDLLAIALADKLHHVHLAFASVSRGRGDLINASFWTKQIPAYAEDDMDPP